MQIAFLKGEDRILFKVHHTMSLFTTELQTSLASNELLATTAVGAVTFPTIMVLAQTTIFKPLRITCADRLAPIFGGLSVSLVGFTVSFAAIKACSLVQDSLNDANSDNAGARNVLSFSTPELVISTVSSVVIFRALGGRFLSVLPSHLFHPGAFAVERVPALCGQQAAVTTEKVFIRDYSRRYGCHTCGKKQVKMFVCDHQPPSHLLRKTNSSSTAVSGERSAAGEVKVNVMSSSNANGTENGATVKQFFYPQCYDCSSMQGGLLNGGNQSRTIITHPFSLRLYHVFLPVPFTIAYLKSSLQDTPSLAQLAPATSSGGVLKSFYNRSCSRQSREGYTDA